MTEFEELYNSACGIVGIINCDTKEEFENEFTELLSNPDFTFMGRYDMTQDADSELEYQGLSLDQITKMSLNQYGNVIETLHNIEESKYYIFIGVR